ncbi:hypothetical protein [Burkholderia phage FLC9]|nr:hypothetical protein [Burkholderia phage FLC9]
MNDNNFRFQPLSRALTEALVIAQNALISEAHQLKGHLESDPKCIGQVAEVIEEKMHETFEATQVIRDTIKRRGHKDVVQRIRDHEPWLRSL